MNYLKSILNNPTKQTALLVSFLTLGIVAYLYFLNMSVVEVVMRKEAMQTQNNLQAEIAVLETDYIKAQHKIAANITLASNDEQEITKTFIKRKDNSSLVLAPKR